jgi:hypothetical protein
VSQIDINVTATKTSKNGVDMAARQIKTAVDSIPLAAPYSDTAFAVYGIAKSLLDGLFPGGSDGERISSSQGVSLSEVPNGIYVIFASAKESDYAKYKQGQSALSWKNNVLTFTENGSAKLVDKVAYFVVKAEWSSTRFKGVLNDELSATEPWGKAFRDAEDAARRVNLGITGTASAELVIKTGEVELLKIQNMNKDAYVLLMSDKGLTTKEANEIKKRISAYTERLCIARMTKSAKAILGPNFTPTWQNSFEETLEMKTTFLKATDGTSKMQIANRVQDNIL